MPLTRPRPRSTDPVVKLIREHVPRPEELPKPYWASRGCLRFGQAGSCPMLMLPRREYRRISSDEWDEFAVWWDSLDDPRAAVRSVWGDG